MGQNVQRSAEGSVKIRRRGSRPGRVPRILREASPLYGGNGNAVRAVDHLRKADPPAPRQRARDRHALSFGGGHSSGGRKARPAWPHDQGGRPLRLFVFAPAEDPVAPASSFTALCQFLAESRQSPVRRYTPKGADIDAVIDVRAIFQQGHRELAIERCRRSLCPRRAATGFVTTKRCSAPT